MKRILGSIFIIICAIPAFSQRYKPLDCGVTLSLVPQMSENGSWAINLRYATNDVYECSNYALGVESFPGGGKLHVVINGLAEPKSCDDVLGPATCIVDITNVGSGTQKFTTLVNRMNFKGTLSVTDSYFELLLDGSTDRDLLKIHNPRLNLIPKNSVWGKLEYLDAPMKEVAIQFMNDLKTEGAVATELAEGNYAEFYLHEKGTTQEKAVTSLKKEYPYIFHYEGDPERLKLLLDMYGQRYAGKLKISMAFSNGKRFSAGNL